MKKYALLLFVISIIYTIAINTYNLKAIREKNPETFLTLKIMIKFMVKIAGVLPTLLHLVLVRIK